MTKLFSLFILLSFVLPVSGQKKLDSDKARKEKAYHLTGSVREQGELPDSRMCAHAARRGYNLTHRSRPVRTDDFYNFDLIIGMDDRNIDDLKERAPSTEEWKKIHRMTEYCTKFTHADHVPDPYYGGAEGFEYVLDVLEDACAGLLEAIND